ncbi:hypothetical protein [Pseudomonas sp. CCC3.1]
MNPAVSTVPSAAGRVKALANGDAMIRRCSPNCQARQHYGQPMTPHC